MSLTSAKWRLIDVERLDDPYYNMAIEEAIPVAVGEGKVPNTLRFWRNDKTVVIGRFQCVRLEVDLSKCLEKGISVVRRFTGGGAVYHDSLNLNFALSVKKPSDIFGDDLFENFRLFGEGIARGLRKLGLPAEFVPINDVQIGGKKVSGMAGSVTDKYVFLHACLLVGSDLKVLGKVLKAPRKKLEAKRVRSVRARVTTLEAELGKGISMERVKKAISEGISEVLGVEFEVGELTPYEEELARKLYAEKYLTPEWNLFCPPCDWCGKWKEDEAFTRYMRYLEEYVQGIRP